MEGIYIRRHPDTGFEFAGFIVPHFEAAKDMAKAAAAFLPDRWLDGISLLQRKDHVLVEGNH